MEESGSVPQIGQIVQIKRGRETGQYAIVIDIDNDQFVWLADGDKRKYDRPKKKNMYHIEVLDFVSPEVRNSLLETGRVTNGKLRFAISKYANMVVADLKKGDRHDGKR